MKISSITFRNNEAFLTITDNENHLLGVFNVIDNAMINELKQYTKEEMELIFKVKCHQ